MCIMLWWGEGDDPVFPLSWTPDPKFTMRVDSCVLPPLDCEVIQVLEFFFPLECSTLIIETVKKTTESRST